MRENSTHKNQTQNNKKRVTYSAWNVPPWPFILCVGYRQETIDANFGMPLNVMSMFEHSIQCLALMNGTNNNYLINRALLESFTLDYNHNSFFLCFIQTSDKFTVNSKFRISPHLRLSPPMFDVMK